MLFDTHTNLHSERYEENYEDILVRARDAGVSRFITICDRLESFETIAHIAKTHSDVWCSVGVHPHHAKEFTDLTKSELLSRISDNRVCAIGETGLDQHYGYSDLNEQLACFRTHIHAAQETQLPLIVHTREADNETAEMLEQESARKPFPILMHCYTSGADLAQRALELGAYFSISGIYAFKNANDVRAVMNNIPLERIILETDCPYLAPPPHRGRTNEPAFLVEVCKAFASERGLTPEEAANLTTQNALRLFQEVT